MEVIKYINKSCVLPKLEAVNKSGALKELTHLLFEKRRLKGMGSTLDQVMAREANESTGIGRHIAVPHARVPGLKNLICGVGRVAEGMEFMALDKKPVHLIFLICYPPTLQTTYLNFVATIARILRDPEHYQSLVSAETADEMYDVIEKISKGFTDTHVARVRKMRTDPEIEHVPDAHADLILMARLQLYQEMLDGSRSGKAQIKKQIENIRALVAPRILKHFDRLMKSRAPGLVSVEADICQGCFMKLPSKFAQQVRQDSDHIHTCINCSRYIYLV